MTTHQPFPLKKERYFTKYGKLSCHLSDGCKLMSELSVFDFLHFYQITWNSELDLGYRKCYWGQRFKSFGTNINHYFLHKQDEREDAAYLLLFFHFINNVVWQANSIMLSLTGWFQTKIFHYLGKLVIARFKNSWFKKWIEVLFFPPKWKHRKIEHFAKDITIVYITNSSCIFSCYL